MREFEGKDLGERFVQEVKEAREHCSHQNVAFNLLQRLHQGKAVESMTLTQSARVQTYKSMDTTCNKKQSLKGNVRVYPTKAHANVSFLSKKPISAVQTLRPEFGILFYENGSNRGKIKLLMLDRNLEEGISVCRGLQYWKWSLT